MTPTILVIGTHDTKAPELAYLADRIRAAGGRPLHMDVSVLGDPPEPVEIGKAEVAAAGGRRIEDAMGAEDENAAMQIMAAGAAALTRRLHAEGRIDGVIALGGSMGTDLALDVAAALPIGVPKVMVSTVSFSPMIPPERLAPDIQMILWAGGLYGLNDICRAALSQAAGAVVGAARTAERPAAARPMIGMTSFGKTVLRYMVPLKPALESRGFDVAVFHATGMGGRAFEGLAAAGAFAAVMDFAPQEVGNHMMGSSITAGPDRMTAAGRAGVPQIVAPGCYDLADFAGSFPLPDALAGRPVHAHNRLISSVLLDEGERRALARLFCARMAEARGPVAFILPARGCNEWDRPGAPLHDAAGLAAFCDEMRRACPAGVDLIEIDAHINDPAFADAALAVLDRWVAEGQLSGSSRERSSRS
ncbi:MAG: Tm-1-like ATP-binding domain-containing protein [Gemmobacter sp.]